uniref:Mediator of RNA polymerase II transcription subunit 14 RM3 domain-containing protein n=1 Tax=Meloidogyne incognita TaxID=6306 RepID=A0A914L915_MELIC
MVTLIVPNEFEIVLTRLGDDLQTKWCLLNIKILVTNAEVGQGQRLVHPLQVNFLHQMVQERLDNGEKPLFDAYNILHVFCRSLQLDVIYCQATLIAKISSLYIRVEEYNTKECKLVIAYWLEGGGGGGGVQQQQSQQQQQKQFRSKKQIHHYRFTIYGDKTDPHSTLRVKHHPAGPELPKLDQSFSLQRLLNETILFRCRERLLQAQNLLERAQPKPAKITRSGHCLLSLTCPLILTEECITAEALIISVNTFFGTVNCRVETLGRRDEINELEKQLNAASPSIKIIVNLLDRLRILILMERLQRAIVGLQVNKLNDNQALSLANKLTTLPKDRSIFQFIREDQFYLIIAFMPDDQIGVKIQFHLFSSTDGRLTMLDLDAEQIIRSAPLPRLYAASSISALSSSSKSNNNKNLHNQRLSEFFQRYRKREGKMKNKIF